MNCELDNDFLVEKLLLLLYYYYCYYYIHIYIYIQTENVLENT